MIRRILIVWRRLRALWRFSKHIEEASSITIELEDERRLREIERVTLHAWEARAEAGERIPHC